jgi:signal transduction histidine kinase
LDLKLMEDGRLPLRLEAVDVRELVDEAFRLYAPLASEQGLRQENAIQEALPPISADRALLLRVVQNLVGNALKFTPPHGRVWVEAWEEPPGYLLLAVSDTGPGIPPELKEQLFQKFVTGRVEGRGSGLGLAFCRLAVEAHGGRTWVESTTTG